MKNSYFVTVNGKSAIYRILAEEGDSLLIVEMDALHLPYWINNAQAAPAQYNGTACAVLDELNNGQLATAHRRFTMIAGILPVIGDGKAMSKAIKEAAEKYGVSIPTVRKYLCLYLQAQDIAALVGVRQTKKASTEKPPLSAAQKNFRWALNKYYYTQKCQTLRYTYTMMLKEKYARADGTLKEGYPSYYQFRYYYRQHKTLQRFYISRGGLKDYQKNKRPLLGDGVQEFAPASGVGMVDSTICDIYLANEAGQVVGRPIFAACIDAYSGYCLGYSLGWEGGTHSVKALIQSICADKTAICRKFGVDGVWDNTKLPARIITDMGKEYIAEEINQLSELGIILENLPAYRPELKGTVEKFFDVVQGYFKPYLKGRGVIEPDYRQRGAHDYRKDACMTLNQFEAALLHCILYYNNKRVVNDFPYTEEMTQKGIKPYAVSLFEYGCSLPAANMIAAEPNKLMLTLLPRTAGIFKRNGFIVNGMRYKNEDFIEEYLSGGGATAAYDPDDVGTVWLIEKGAFIPFYLIESRYSGKSFNEAAQIKQGQKDIVKAASESKDADAVKLAKNLTVIAETCQRRTSEQPIAALAHGIRKTRQKEIALAHMDERGIV